MSCIHISKTIKLANEFVFNEQFCIIKAMCKGNRGFT